MVKIDGKWAVEQGDVWVHPDGPETEISYTGHSQLPTA